MYFDLLLLSVILATVYLGPLVIRRQPPGQRTYGWLLCADGACAAVSLYARHSAPGADVGDLLGFIAIAAGVFLIVIPPVLRDLTRRALLADRLGLAGRLIDARELLQPGMGAEREREFIAAVMAVRSGDVDDAVAMLRETRDGLADPEARAKLDERIVLTYLWARRWQDAIEAYRASHDPGGGPTALPPQLLVELTRAHCEVGDLAAAAELVTALEQALDDDDPLQTVLLARARMVFLAHTGRVEAVQTILGPAGPLAMLPAAARHYWSGIARLAAGDRSGARADLERVVRLTRRDKQRQAVARDVLDRVDQPGVAGPHPLAAEIAQLVDHLSAAVSNRESAPRKVMPQLVGTRLGRIPVTVALVASNLAVFAALMLVYGSTQDAGALVRAGANLRSEVWAGEWWRLVSSMFLHVGLPHLLINVYVLWVLGKLIEPLYGSSRFLALYMLAGAAGAAASALAGPGLSAGASGAIMGLMGALIVELALHRAAYPEGWRKHMFRLLVFITAAQVVIGFLYAQIDQAAHVGGLIAGGALAALLSPRWRASGSHGLRVLVAFLAAASAAAVVVSAVAVVTTDYAETLARHDTAEHSLDGFTVVAPENWLVRSLDEGDSTPVLVDPLGVNYLQLTAKPRDPAGRTIAEELVPYLASWRDQPGFRARPEADPLALPEPWQGQEYSLLDGDQSYRLIAFGRVAPGDGDEVWLGGLYVPEVLAPGVRPTLEVILSSLRRP